MSTSNEHSMVFITTTNGGLCDFLRSVCSFLPLPSHRKMADNINVTERNTLPVLYNINSSTVILLYHQQYISLYIYHHTVQVARVQVQYLRQWVDEKAPPAQVAQGEPPCVQVDYLR